MAKYTVVDSSRDWSLNSCTTHVHVHVHTSNSEYASLQFVFAQVSKLTTDEAIQQTWTIAPAISRLGIKAYNWR